MKLIVGLGNPGKEYQNTRHNVGFIVVDSFAGEDNFKKQNNYMIYETNINNEKIIFLKPLTYMNLSGNAISYIVNYYKIDSNDILIIHDDLDLPKMKYRLKFASSSGGHNGIKSIISSLGTDKFSHLKIGIGNEKLYDTKDYVLSKLSNDEINFLKEDKFKQIINSFIVFGIDKTMNDFNHEEK